MRTSHFHLFFHCLFFNVCLLFAKPSELPNILWLTSEDNSVKWVGCYGACGYSKSGQTGGGGVPLSQLFCQCSRLRPSRSGWITGVHPVTLGTLPMRSRYEIPHDQIKYYPDYLKDAGYYCSNVRKTDYNIGGRHDDACWGSTRLDWKNSSKPSPSCR